MFKISFPSIIALSASAMGSAFERFGWIFQRKLSSDSIFSEIKIPVRASVYFFLLFFLVVGLWFSLVPLSSFVGAIGTVEFINEMKVVKAPVSGVVDGIFVKNGDFVDKGQRILSINSAHLEADLRSYKNSLFELEITEFRLLSELKDLDKIDFPKKFFEVAGEDSSMLELLETQKNLFNLHSEIYKGRLALLKNSVQDIRNEIKGTEFQLGEAEKRRVYLKQGLDDMSKLVDDGVFTKSQLRETMYKYSEAASAVGIQNNALARLKEKLIDSQTNLLNYEAEFKRSIEDEMFNVKAKIAEIKEKISKWSGLIEEQTIYSPQSGIINNMHSVGLGYVLSPGEVIMDVVPNKDDLVVHAKMSVDNIAPLLKNCSGDIRGYGSRDMKNLIEASVRISTYRGRGYRALRGYVTYIAADSAVDSRAGYAYYNLRIVVPDSELGENSGIVLYPGMRAEVQIKALSRTMASYLLDPLISSIRGAFVE